MKTNHKQFRITLTKEVNGVKKTTTGRIVTILRANRKYSTKYLDSLGITDHITNSSNQCRVVLKTLTGTIKVLTLKQNIVNNSSILKFKG